MQGMQETLRLAPEHRRRTSQLRSQVVRSLRVSCLWQMDYLFNEPVTLMAGDTIRATCGYDNSAGHQPVVNGVKRAQPITVGPGEGTADEMCLHYVWLRRPTP